MDPSLCYEDFIKSVEDLTKYNKTKRYGGEKVFEKAVNEIMKSSGEFKSVIPNSQITEELKEHFHLPSGGKGIDGLVQDIDGKYHYYQVKFVSKGSLYDNHLGTFYKTILNTLYGNDNDMGKVSYIITNAPRLVGNSGKSIVVKNGDWIKQHYHHVKEKTPQYIREQTLAVKRKIPYQIQEEIISKTVEYFTDGNNRATLILPCGFGKTLISMWIVERLFLKVDEQRETTNEQKTIIVFLEPTLQLVDQNCRLWENELYKRYDPEKIPMICIGSGQEDKDFQVSLTIDQQKIDNFLSGTQDVKIVFSTYDSFHKVSKYNISLCIFDEAHLTCGKIGKKYNKGLENTYSPADIKCIDNNSPTISVISEDDKTPKIKEIDIACLCGTNENIHIDKRLFLTATPKVNPDVHIGVEHSDINTFKYMTTDVYQMYDENIYGKTLFNYGFKKGIDADLLCNYKIIYLIGSSQHIKSTDVDSTGVVSITDNPHIVDSSDKSFDGKPLDGKLNVNDLNDGIYDRGCIFLMENAINYLSGDDKCRKMLVFTTSIRRMKQLQKIYKDVNSRRKVLIISSETKRIERNEILDDFYNAEEPVILISCRILLLGYDCPPCDSVFFHIEKKSVVDCVQAMSRCLRVFEGKKIAKIIFPYITYDTGIWDWEQKGNDLFSTLRQCIYHLAHYDESIIEKIEVYKENKLTRERYMTNGDDVNENDPVEFLPIDKEILKHWTSFLKVCCEFPVTSEIDIWKKFLSNLNPKLHSEEEYHTFRKAHLSLGLPENLEGQVDEIGDSSKKIMSWNEFLGLTKEDFYSLKEIRNKIAKKCEENGCGEIDQKVAIYRQLRNGDKKFPYYVQILDDSIGGISDLFPDDAAVI